MTGPDRTSSPHETDAAFDAQLESQLAHALAPVDPPAGFAERVLARAAAESRPMPAPRSRLLHFPLRLRSLPAAGAIAAALLVAALTSYDHHQRLAERAAATRQFDLATEITDQALQQAEQQAHDQMLRARVPLNDIP